MTPMSSLYSIASSNSFWIESYAQSKPFLGRKLFLDQPVLRLKHCRWTMIVGCNAPSRGVTPWQFLSRASFWHLAYQKQTPDEQFMTFESWGSRLSLGCGVFCSKTLSRFTWGGQNDNDGSGGPLGSLIWDLTYLIKLFSLFMMNAYNNRIWMQKHLLKF